MKRTAAEKKKKPIEKESLRTKCVKNYGVGMAGEPMNSSPTVCGHSNGWGEKRAGAGQKDGEKNVIWERWVMRACGLRENQGKRRLYTKKRSKKIKKEGGKDREEAKSRIWVHIRKGRV